MEIAPVRKSLLVPADPRRAFHRFTHEIGRWWPRATHSVHGADAVGVEMQGRVGGAIVEHARSGERCTWGTVTAWEPGERVAFTWHPGRDEGTAQHVDVTFEPEGDGTRVVLVHSGWERLGDDAAETRDEYEQGWVPVLGAYASSLEAAGQGASAERGAGGSGRVRP